MVKGGGVLGALLGAGGTAAYYNGIDVTAALRGILNAQPTLPAWNLGQNTDLDQLRRLVEQLARDVNTPRGGVTIVQQPHGRGTGFVLYAVAVAGAGVLYLRIWRGWKFTDMMYVTRSSLNSSLGRVTAGVEGLSQRLQNVKAFLQQQVEAVSKKQDETIAAQQVMQRKLETVGTDVEGAREQVAGVHASVMELEGTLGELNQQQLVANDGIYLLCRVVGDLMSRAGHRGGAMLELEEYVRKPRLKGPSRLHGLEGLLPGSEGSPSAATLSLAGDGARSMVLSALPFQTAASSPAPLGSEVGTDPTGGLASLVLAPGP
eukprot:jgi/Botrbrau1/3984/Bobra.0365s0056.1